MEPVSIIKGKSPIIFAQPHSGTYVPDDIWRNLNELGRQLIDTDWHIPSLYQELAEAENITVIRANFSRYVIDANRDPDGASLYPGQNTTEMVPTCTFDGEPIWLQKPTQADIGARLEKYHQAYHCAIEAEVSRLREEHASVMLYDCHSIRSRISYLFDDLLPVLSIGTNSGESCSAKLEQAVVNACEQSPEYSHVLNGRFKGGWTTRHYGRPSAGVHAVQMEIAQRAYLKSETPPFEFDDRKAHKLQKVLKSIFKQISNTLNKHFDGEQS